MDRKLKKIQEDLNIVEPSPISKIFFVCFFLFSIAILSGYTAYLLGSKYFFLDKYIGNSHKILDYFVSLVMFYVNFIPMIGYSLKISIKKSLKLSIGYIPLWLYVSIICSHSFITSGVIPGLYIIIIGIITKKELKNPAKNYIIISFFIILYQFLTVPIKMNLPVYSTEIISLSSRVYFQIDQVVFIVIIYLMEVSKNAELVYLVFPEKILAVADDDEDLEALREYHSLCMAKRIKTALLIFLFQIFQLLLILTVSSISNVLVECIVILISFFSAGTIIKRRWHSKSLVLCTLASMVLFYGASRISIPYRISFFIPILIGVFICYSLYIAAAKTEGPH